ncbi:MAG: 3-deoxy-8-phosphooctulonate synthase, partial [Elusimicrobiales bacterium]|nr:3-deoxy-8-phosphooctulonate synthase [Elusimicrobiales bacterium]
FVSPYEVENIIKKIESTGNKRIMITERGTTFGYNNLVVDMRSFEIIKKFGYPVIFDATHSVQRPGGLGTSTAGDREFVFPLSKSAVAQGIAGVFFETHINPEKALSDGPNSLKLKDVKKFVSALNSIDR